MSKPNLIPQKPGEAKKPDPQTNVSTDAPKAAETETVEPETVPPAPSASIPAPAVAVTRPRPPGELPDQSEIDPDKIKRKVMTKQGWVVPSRIEATEKIGGK